MNTLKEIKQAFENGQNIFRRSSISILIKCIEELESVKPATIDSDPVYIFLDDRRIAKVVNTRNEKLTYHKIDLDAVFEDVCPVCGEEFSHSPCSTCGFDSVQENFIEAANRYYKHGRKEELS